MNKKDEILQVTIRLFHEKGETVSLDDIAKEVGCSKTLIIHYYGKRENLLKSCFSLVCHEVRLAISEVQAPEGCSKEDMRRYLTDIWRSYFNYLKDNPVKARFFIQYSHGIGTLPPRYKTPEAVIKRILDERYGHLMDEDPELMFSVTYMIAIANGMAALVFSDHAEPTEELTERCIDRIMNGVLKER